MGLIFDKLKLYKQAINEYRIAIKLEPSYANAHFVLGQVYENKGIIEKAVAEYEKFVRIHETGAMVEEAKTRIARIRNISLEDVEQSLAQKKQDAPGGSGHPERTVSQSPTPATPTTNSPPVPATATGSQLNSTPSPNPAPADPGSVKLTDPKEYLKQVLAKARAAKNPQAAAPETIPAGTPGSPAAPTSSAASATLIPQVPKPVTVPKPTPSLAPDSVSEPTPPAAPQPKIVMVPRPQIPVPAPAPSPMASPQPAPVPAPVSPPPEETAPPTDPVSLTTQPEPAAEGVLPTPLEPVAQVVPIAMTSPEVSNAATAPATEPAFSFDNLPVSALDGYELDEQDVLNAIAHVDTQSVEQESQVLETVEAIGLSSSDEILDDSAQDLPAPSTGTPSVDSAVPPSANPVIQRGFY
jgi:hypothetical protein